MASSSEKVRDVFDDGMHNLVINFFPFLFSALCERNSLILADLLSAGGESIRQINQLSGAHVEINKATTGNTDFKHFVIRGRLFEIQVVMCVYLYVIVEMYQKFLPRVLSHLIFVFFTTSCSVHFTINLLVLECSF